MPKNKHEIRLHVVIPTYERMPMLERQAHYIAECIRNGLFPKGNVSITIADGSKDICPIAHDLAVLGIKYLHMPGVEMAARIADAVSSQESEYFMVAGDDDFVDFQNAYRLTLAAALSDYVAIVGSFVNITMWSSGRRPSFSTAERPYHTFDINDSQPLARMATLNAFNSVGISSLAYSIQASVCVEFYRRISGRNFYHGGIEFIHQRWLALNGKIRFSSTCHIYRDFTYFDYAVESTREAPSADAIPYIGQDACKWLSEMLSEYANIDYNESEDLLKNQISLCNSIQVSRLKVFHALERSRESKICASNEINATHVRILAKVWRKNFCKCYPRLGVFGLIKLDIKYIIHALRRL